jgi:RNA polymerase primary sigma factor
MWTQEFVNNDGQRRWFLDSPEAEVMSKAKERSILLELTDCTAQLLQATRRRDGSEWGAPFGDAEFQQVVRHLAEAGATLDPHTAALRTVARRHQELRTALALANSRLVAHIAKQYTNRGVSLSDLIQDGFCGLLMAIDRYDAANTTRLATYAVWWIRQAMQRTIAAGAYPVRLNPKQLQRLLRALASCPVVPPGVPAVMHHPTGDCPTMTWRELAAVRPRVPLDAPCRNDGSTPLADLLVTAREPEANENESVEYLHSLLSVLKPRELVVLRLRFGLDGESRHSLSQVSRTLSVSKERIRQIQERALEKLRNAALEREASGPSRGQPLIALPLRRPPA